ncbi:HD domain-containing protein [Bombella apis]|uniref:HD domain-containing protein n=1 Tax=Bombella apis TaxID=1785988 RepID=A0ABR9MQN0_9PROT|nr:HD domain-containing protein [Bombella apis]MBE1723691.1 HD domain-containing protein [Bombella apis]MBR9731314.1 HD domain-containing protein [Bombella apis]
MRKSIRINEKFHSLEKYDYNKPLNEGHYKSDQCINEFLYKIIGTSTFNRLNDIRFLGGIDLFYRKNQKNSLNKNKCTRFQHSLGVARLAMFYAYKKELDIKQRKLIGAAALLHDIGHAPLSHTLENFFKRNFNINHHEAGIKIIQGESPYKREITDILISEKIDPDEIIKIISGKDDRFDNFFSGPINFDTIEGILRSHLYLEENKRAPHPEEIILAAIYRQNSESEKTVDTFWKCKEEVYNTLIRSEEGIISDYICELFSSNILEKNDYFLTDDKLFEKVPQLRNLVWNGKKCPSFPCEEVTYIARSFFINREFSFKTDDDKLRYAQRKERKTLSLDSIKCRSLF